MGSRWNANRESACHTPRLAVLETFRRVFPLTCNPRSEERAPGSWCKNAIPMRGSIIRIVKVYSVASHTPAAETAN